ncbi:hypothetical protein B4589_006930 [Halolamina sp. CBA1230]|uniref:hypothetical protein n=1 Tax=Halolamina sp. CBA1230 TaxID=1853690 RepID=UPI0009A1F5E4|nr:hypothetical protein [Halolamina sp. CBA1230]QKY20125.1 hypothetical protein B4589_006930 [Halolamina sp. CBA1230]
MPPNSLHRRRLLAATLTTAVAGCSTLPVTGSTAEQLVFDELHRTPTYVADAVDLTLHEEIPTVRKPDLAELVLLPGDTEVGPEQAANWLTDDRSIALLGGAAEPTWIDWEESDAFAETFENEGIGDSEPDPQLLVGVTFENRTSTYGRTWADDPGERDLIQALDEILVSIEERTPR